MVDASRRSLPVDVPHHGRHLRHLALHRVQPGDGARVQLGHQLLWRARQRVVRGFAGPDGDRHRQRREVHPAGCWQRIHDWTVSAAVRLQPSRRRDRRGVLRGRGGGKGGERPDAGDHVAKPIHLQHHRGGRDSRELSAAAVVADQHDVDDGGEDFRRVHPDGGAAASAREREGRHLLSVAFQPRSSAREAVPDDTPFVVCFLFVGVQCFISRPCSSENRESGLDEAVFDVAVMERVHVVYAIRTSVCCSF